jgi:site-specific DNA-methyltransferase (adenine-specific)
MMNLEDIMGTIINGDCNQVMKTFPESSIDLVVTSCPYGVGIKYDIHDDDMEFETYKEFSKDWLRETYRVLKDDGRIALNIPLEINRQEKGGRIFFASEMWQIMKEIGFKWFGLIDLEEDSPHRSKTTAWGSWMSCSQPYIYNPKECIIIAYKNSPKKLTKGEPQWKGTPTEIEQEDGTIKKKVVYEDADKKDFMELVFGQWKYLNDSRPMTKATFSMDIPTKAIKILTYKNDVILDPFAGSGTSLVAAEILDRRWVGIELSPNYVEIARNRVQHFVEEKKQNNIKFSEEGE